MAELIAEALVQFAPTSNLYRLGGGQYVVITRPDPVQPVPEALAALIGAVKIGHVESSPTEVFLCDEDARLIDADGDPTNGMTALLSLPAGTGFDEAVMAAERELS